MSGNTERFTGRVEEYARFRSGYPAAEVAGFLRGACGLTAAWRVADVAAGTGMLTEVLLGNGNAVVAIEPNAEMRAACAGLRARWPGLEVLEGTAETTGVAAGSVEMVVAGRAFHWFEPVAAAEEFRRVLVPGGWVALVSSGRRRGDSAQELELEELLMEHGTDYAYVRDRYRREDRMMAFFKDLAGVDGTAPVRAEFAAERRLTWERFAGMVQSMSVAPLREDAARYAGMQAALAAFFARWSEEGELRMVEVCYLKAGRVAL